jgi:glycerol kinase
VAQAGDALVRAPGLLTTVAWRLPGEAAQYGLEAPAFVAGAAIDWMAGILGLSGAADFLSLAATVPDPAGVAFVPALAGLGAPEWDPGAGGLFIGLHRGATRAHLARATCEALAFQTRSATALMAGAGVPLAQLRVDGGLTASDFFLQLQADALGVPVTRSALREATAWGAYLLAGVGAGLWGPEETARRWRPGTRFDPQPTAGLEERFGAWRRAVQRALQWAPA